MEVEIGSLRPKVRSLRPKGAVEAEIGSLRPKEAVEALIKLKSGSSGGT